MSAATLWEQYVGAYHGFWDYLAEHEEILQKESNVTLVRYIMEKCPVVNFSCVRDLTYTMRQFLGEKRFKKKESWWRERLESKIKECIVSISNTDEEEFMACMQTADLGVWVNSNIFPEEHLTRCVQHQFTRRAGCLVKKQDCLRKLSDWRYKSQVYGQDTYRQQALIINVNILYTFCHNLVRYFEINVAQCGTLLRRLAQEAFDPEDTCIKAADYYLYIPYQRSTQTLTRISIWPLHEPVVSSYDDRKIALSQRWEDAKRPKSIMPPIYTPLGLDDSGEKISFQKRIGDEVAFVKSDVIPHKITCSRHFRRVMRILQSKRYDLNHNETDTTRKKNWLYYCVMFDPTVSPEAADQGYIGMTTRDLVTRWKEHVRLKDKSVIEYNLALVSQYARCRGKDLSEYVAVFVLGTTAASSTLGTVKGKLIRETSEGGFTVGNMKYGMNDKRAAQNN